MINEDGSEPREIQRFSGVQPKGFLLSPDGSRIAYLVEAALNRIDLWVMNADGSDPRKLVASNPFSVSVGCWSPDGLQIACSAFDWDAGKEGICIAGLDGTRRFLHPSGVGPRHGGPALLSWSPQGTVPFRMTSFSVYGMESTSGPQNLYLMDADGSNIRLVVSGESGFRCWSPGGDSFLLQPWDTASGRYRPGLPE